MKYNIYFEETDKEKKSLSVAYNLRHPKMRPLSQKISFSKMIIPILEYIFKNIFMLIHWFNCKKGINNKWKDKYTVSNFRGPTKIEKFQAGAKSVKRHVFFLLLLKSVLDIPCLHLIFEGQFRLKKMKASSKPRVLVIKLFWQILT